MKGVIVIYINLMIIFLKKILYKFIDSLGYSIIKNNSYNSLQTVINKKFKDLSHLYKILIPNKNPIIFDVGANLGQSILLFKNHFPSSQIYSFEPIPECYKKIYDEYKNNDDVKIFNQAIAEKEGKKIFNVYSKSGQSSFFQKKTDTQWYRKNLRQEITDRNQFKLEEKKIEVNLITLDTFCEKNGIDVIDFLKIDTQGYEEFVLQGANNLLKNNKINAIKLEMFFSKIYEKQHSFYEIEKYLHNYGYRLFGINKPGNLYDDIVFQIDAIYTLEKFQNNL